MEKKTAHYPLAAIQAQIKTLGIQAFTATAIRGGWQMGLTTREMLAVLAGLTRKNLYKSMTTFADHSVWQDVYHAPVDIGGIRRTAYIKVTLRENTPVIQFKEK
ncbi:type II toxin-antitoxin system MqsR family toxin [Stutzerimonas kunmingensis]|uniref:type II toxin-antitoxin system MqsR family toxin n=1 Tax=Stutzerimonas kunmingensis TaxID=1211807 RepID=UPI00241E96E6|nr:type II toxin-antitoxin system MqsR family toxin [Stutzerimonas kunmingensis]